jgi:hypothetical protein
MALAIAAAAGRQITPPEERQQHICQNAPHLSALQLGRMLKVEITKDSTDFSLAN